MDSGRVCTIINRSFANVVVTHSKENYWTQTAEFQDLKTFSNKSIKTIGVINTTVECNDWIAANVNIAVVDTYFTPTHQKRRRVPISFQYLVNTELKKLLKEKNISKLDICSDKNFISPIFIPIKRDKTVKKALNSKI